MPKLSHPQCSGECIAGEKITEVFAPLKDISSVPLAQEIVS